MSDTSDALAALLASYFDEEPSTDSWTQRQEFDAEWLSPCQLGEPDDEGMILWRPVRSQTPIDWEQYEARLGCPIRPELKDYYGSYWCSAFETAIDEGNIIVIQFWNEADRERRLAGLVDLAARQRDAGESPRLTVAVFTDDRYLSCHLDDGAILLEDPGRDPRVAFSSLPDFLSTLAAG